MINIFSSFRFIIVLGLCRHAINICVWVRGYDVNPISLTGQGAIKRHLSKTAWWFVS